MISLPKQIGTLLLLVLVSLLAAIAYGHHRYTQGLAYGQAKALAAQAAVDRAAAAQAQRRVTEAAQAGHALAVQINTTLPKIEVASHDTAQRIRILYLAAPVTADGRADCARPPSVQEHLAAAIDRANAAATGALRSDPSAPTAAAPTASAKRR